MGEISNQLDRIISGRNARVSELDKVKENVNSAREKIRLFHEFQNEIKNGLVNSDEEANALNNIGLIPLRNFTDKYDDYIKEFNGLKKRLSRDNLHISFVGAAGMGKSLLMQRISGLNGSVIPSEEGSDCTGAKSIITNCSHGATEAEIIFYDKKEMVDKINAYLKELKAPQNITCVEDIPSIDLRAIKSNFSGDDDIAAKVKLLEHLEKYVNHYYEYCSNLGKNRDVSEDEIIKYVAQHDSQNNYYHYLGVKLANIKTHFPFDDAGRIVLVDTVGTGDTSLGVEESLAGAVKDDSDAIILLFKPGSRSGLRGAELNVLSIAQKNLTPDYTGEMLFFVVNRHKGQNDHLIDGTIADVSKRDYKIAKVLDVDCFSKEEVESKLLIPVLKQLSERIGKADDVLIKRVNKLGNELYNEYHKICDEIDRIYSKATTSDIKRNFESRIKRTWDQGLSGKLRELYRTKYHALRSKPCVELEEAAEEKIENIRKWIPTKETILEMLSYGSARYIDVYENCTDILRMGIIDDFTKLDIILGRLVENMKLEVLHIFADEDKGRLGYVVPLNCDSEKWIEMFLTKTNAENNYPQIARALEKFREYTINVQGFLIHEVRDKLDCIDPTLPNFPNADIECSNDDDRANEIIIFLKKYAEKVLNEIHYSLSDLYSVPNRSMFAAIKDLYDRITFNINTDNITNRVGDEWRYLYEDQIHLIWSDDFKRETAQQENAKRRDEVITELKGMDNSDNFKIKE